MAAVFLEKYDLALEEFTPIPTPIFTAVSLVWILHAVASKRFTAGRSPFPALGVTIWISFLAIASFIRVLYFPGSLAGDPLQTILTLAHFVQLSTLALVMWATLSSSELTMVIDALITCAMLAAIIGFVQLVDMNFLDFQLTDRFNWRFRPMGSLYRPVSIFSEPAYYGYYMLFAAGALKWPLSHYHTRARRFAPLLILASVSTLSLGPIFALIGYTAIWLIVARNRRDSIIGLVLAMGTTIIISPIGLLLSERLSRVLEMSDSSTIVRAEMNSASLELLAANPLFGVGLGQARFSLPELVAATNFGYNFTGQAGNSYLAILVEQGAAGAAPLFLTLTIIAVRLLSRSGSNSSGILILTVLLISWLAISSIGLPISWVLIGILMSMDKVCFQCGQACTLGSCTSQITQSPPKGFSNART